MKGISPMAMIRIGRLWSRISYVQRNVDRHSSVVIILHLLIIFGQSSFAGFFVEGGQVVSGFFS